MKQLTRFCAVLSLVAACTSVTAAQDMSSNSASIPKVLQIFREFTKPGKAGMIHDKSEGAFVDAMARAKWPTHYLAMTSLSGKPRALYLTPYASLDAWQKDTDAAMKNLTLTGALERASMADGELLESADSGVFLYREDMSLRPRADLSQMRYMEINLFHVRPGKGKQWDEVVKMAKFGYEKGMPDMHWAMFEQVYGADEGIFLLLTSHKALAEIDKAFAEDKQFREAMGEDGMKKLDELYSECCELSQQQLFAFSPAQSYVEDSWIKADPDFWKRKPAAAPVAKASSDDKKPKP